MSSGLVDNGSFAAGLKINVYNTSGRPLGVITLDANDVYAARRVLESEWYTFASYADAEAWLKSPQPCSECRGSGKTATYYRFQVQTYTCDECEGTGAG